MGPRSQRELNKWLKRAAIITVVNYFIDTLDKLASWIKTLAEWIF